MENNFDKSYRKQLESHKSSLDLDQFWNELEPKLPQKNKRRYFFWWFVPGLILVGIFIAKINYFPFEKKEPNNVLELIKSIATSNDSINQNSKNSSGHLTIQSSQDADKKTTENNLKTDNINNQMNKENIKQSNLLNVKESSNSLALHANQSNSVHSSNSTQMQSNNLNFSDSIRSNKDLNLYTESPEANIIANENRISVEKEQKVIEQESEMNIDKSELSNQKNENHIPAEETKIVSQSDHQSNSNVNNSSNNSDSSLSYLMLVDSLNNISTNFSDSKLKETKNFNFYIKPLFCIGAYSKNYKAIDSSNINYLLARKSTESNLEEWSVNLLSGMQWHRWSLETGLSYLQRNEKFEFIEEKENFTFGSTTLKREFINGKTDSIQTEAWHNKAFNRQVIHYNKLSQCNIPITLSYDCYKSNLWTFGVYAGLLMSVSSNYQGRLLTKNLQITEIDQKILTNNLGFTSQTGIFIRFRYSDQVELFSSMQYNHFLTSLHIEHLQLTYNSLQLGLGVQLKLY